MEKLSPEILALIVDHLTAETRNQSIYKPRQILGTSNNNNTPPPPPYRYAPYASISRTWQLHIERHTFKKLRIVSDEDLPTLAEIISHPSSFGPGPGPWWRRHRLSLVRELTYVIILPTDGGFRRERVRNNVAFGSAIKGLFDLLQSWEPDQSKIQEGGGGGGCDDDDDDDDGQVGKKPRVHDGQGGLSHQPTDTTTTTMTKFSLRLSFGYDPNIITDLWWDADAQLEGWRDVDKKKQAKLLMDLGFGTKRKDKNKKKKTPNGNDEKDENESISSNNNTHHPHHTPGGPVDYNYYPKSARNPALILGPSLILPTLHTIQITQLSISGATPIIVHPTAICRLAGFLSLSTSSSTTTSSPGKGQGGGRGGERRGLESLSLEYRDPEPKRHALRREYHHTLARGLQTLVRDGRLSNLRRLSIQRSEVYDPYNHNFHCQDLTDRGGGDDDNNGKPPPSVDILCNTIRTIAQSEQLTELKLIDIPISEDLFRDPRTSSSSSSSFFPSLKHLTIRAGIVAPNGTWYYTGNPSEVEAGPIEREDLIFDSESDSDSDDDDDDDNSSSSSSSSSSSNIRTIRNSSQISSIAAMRSRDDVINGQRPDHQWRTRPDPITLGPLVRHLVHAVQHHHQMPNLVSCELEIGSNLSEPVGILLKYCAPTSQSAPGAGEVPKSVFRNTHPVAQWKLDAMAELTGYSDTTETPGWEIQ